MSTLGDIKHDVAGQLGATDGATSEAKRDRAINRARRKFYSEKKWSFCLVPGTTVAIASQLGTLPSNYNKKYDPEAVYYYSGDVKYHFGVVAFNDVDNYDDGAYVIGINRSTGQIKMNQTSIASISMDYYALPADAPIDTTQDATAELAPNIEPITTAAIAFWWLTSERSTANYDRFMDEYKILVANEKKIDSYNTPVRKLNANPIGKGYNSGFPGRVLKGYVGQR